MVSYHIIKFAICVYTYLCLSTNVLSSLVKPALPGQEIYSQGLVSGQLVGALAVCWMESDLLTNAPYCCPAFSLIMLQGMTDILHNAMDMCTLCLSSPVAKFKLSIVLTS